MKEGVGDALGLVMSEISEEQTCAGWLIDLEHFLWQAVTDGPGKYDLFNISHREVTILRELSQYAECWCRWRTEEEYEEDPVCDRPLLVPLEKWKVIHDGWLAKRAK